MTKSNSNHRYMTALRPSLGLILLLCIFFLMLVIVSVIASIVMSKWGDNATALRISTVLQDILVFVLPPMLTAMMVTRFPAEFLEVMKRPKGVIVLLAILTMVVSVPMMNFVIDWNENLHFLDKFEWIKDLEQNAQASIETLLGTATIGNLIISLLIVGCLTGFAEEIFFRGGLQKLLMCARLNPHSAIWITALVFSLFHFQLYGFVPRLLLGAFFGYLMWWSGSLWISVIAHAFNNSIVVATRWLAENNPSLPDIDAIGGVTSSWDSFAIMALSVLLTVIGVIGIKRMSLRDVAAQ